MILYAIKRALSRMDRMSCMLSTLDYNSLEVGESFARKLLKEKYLERPFAYEFYHQFRNLMDTGCVYFGGPIIQAEVDKRYQHIWSDGKIPDFIIHIPNTRANLAVIEFKLASNLDGIEKDFKKLLEFKRDLGYTYIVEVIIGNESLLERAGTRVENISTNEGEDIIVIRFNIETWIPEELVIKYETQNERYT